MITDPDTKEPLPPHQALFYFWQVLEGVNFLHGNGILHLNINSSSILVFDMGRTLKLSDFNLKPVTSEVVNFGDIVNFSAPEVWCM